MNEFEQIESYLNNTLSASERVDFEKLMEQNKDLKTEVLLQQQVNELLLDKFLLEEKQFMKDFMAQQPKPSHWKKYVGIGSAVLALIGLGVFLYEPSKEVEETQKEIVEQQQPINHVEEKEQEQETSIINHSNPKTENNIIVQKTLPKEQQEKTNEVVVIPQEKTPTISENLVQKTPKDTISEKPKVVVHQKYEIQKPTIPIVQKKENEVLKKEEAKIEITKPVYSFSESMQGGFEFTLLENEKPYRLTIISKKGEEVFSKQIENSEWWEGINMRGEKLAQGYYIVLIQFEGGQIIKGSITILP